MLDYQDFQASFFWNQTIIFDFCVDILHTSVSEGFFVKYLAIFFREENVNQKYEACPVKSYFTKQLL